MDLAIYRAIFHSIALLVLDLMIGYSELCITPLLLCVLILSFQSEICIYIKICFSHNIKWVDILLFIRFQLSR